MASGEGIPGLADKLNHLFATAPGPGRSGHYSNDTAAQALEKYGVTVSGVHLSHLRANRRDNPSARLLAALAELFGVPYSYFFDSDTEDTINANLDTLTASRHGCQYDPDLQAILDQIRVMEGLDADPDK